MKQIFEKRHIVIENGILKATKRRQPTYLRNIPTFLTDNLVWQNDKPHTSRFRNETHQHIITELKTIKSMKEAILTKKSN